MTHRDPDTGEPRDRLDDARRALPKEIQPAGDLWPSIRREITHEAALSELERARERERPRAGALEAFRRFFRIPSWGLVGATCAFACVVGAGVTWWMVGGPTETEGVAGETKTAMTATLDGLEHECARLHADLLQLLESAELRPSDETREILFANLAIIETAVAESRAALLANPGDAHLAALTVSAYRERLMFLKDATRVPFGTASATQS